MIRKRNDSDGFRRGAMGIDDDKAGRFTKQNRSDPWTVEPQSVSSVPGSIRRKDTVKSGQGIDGDEGVGILRQKQPDGGMGSNARNQGGRDIYDDVDRNSDDVRKNGADGTGPIKYGVD